MISNLPPPESPSISRKGGFTLIEMLAVVAIVGLLVASVAPMVFSSLLASKLSAAGEMMSAQISYAHQRSVSANEELELRFYKYDDPDSVGNEAFFSAMAVVKVSLTPSANQSVAYQSEQVGDIFYLPGGIALGNSPVFSPGILAASGVSEQRDRDRTIKKAEATYKSFRFFPDGSSDLPPKTASCYITLVEDRYANGNGEVPKNFFAIQIDPSNGRTTTYRP